MAIGDVTGINRALKGNRLVCAPSGQAVGPRGFAALWDAFTRHLFDEVARRGRAALVARPAGQEVQLFAEDAEGRSLGAFRDPLGIAPAMAALGVARIEFTDGERRDCTASAVEDPLRAVLRGGYRPLPDASVHVLGDRFVDAVTGPGLPVLEGVTYLVDPALAARETGEIGLSEFRERVVASRAAEDVLDVLRVRVLPHVEPHERRPFLTAVMRRARRFNEGEDDPGSAIELWCEVARASATPGEQLHTIKIMMSVARQRASVDLPPDARDVGSAIAIYLAVLGLDHSPAQNRAVRLTMMDVANRLTRIAGPRDRLDVDTAVTLWSLVHRNDPDPGSREHTVRAMMEIANKLADTRSEGAPVDAERALTIWRAVHDLDVDEEDRERVRRTMMDRANGLADPMGPGVADLGAALALWGAVHDLQADDPDDQLHVVRTMMAAANRRVDLARPRSELDVDEAIRIWTAIIAISDLRDDRQRAILTMMDLAGRLAGDGSTAGDIGPALQLWDAAYRLGPSAEDRLRVVKTVLDIGSRTPSFCRAAALALDGPRSGRLAPRFRALVGAGLLYYQADHGAVVAFVDSQRSAEPALVALKADALRKLGRLDDALQLALEVVRRVEGHENAGPEDRDAAVSALCCRGYCYLEKGRAGEDTLGRAIEELERAAEAAVEARVPVQPRIFTGLGYVQRLLGRDEQAERAFARALQADGDNRKAAEASQRVGTEPLPASGRAVR